MHTWPIPRGVRPLADISMHNFVYWLSTKHRGSVGQLQNLSKDAILDLIEQFNSERPDLKASKDQWLASLHKLLDSDVPQDDYTKVRNTLNMLK